VKDDDNVVVDSVLREQIKQLLKKVEHDVCIRECDFCFTDHDFVARFYSSFTVRVATPRVLSSRPHYVKVPEETSKFGECCRGMW
jgi:hypothetical protein